MPVARKAPACGWSRRWPVRLPWGRSYKSSHFLLCCFIRNDDMGEGRIRRDVFGTQGVGSQLRKHGACHVAADVHRTTRFVDHDGDDETRIRHRRHADEVTDVFSLRVAAVDHLLDGTGLATDAIAGYLRLDGRTAWLGHHFQHFTHVCSRFRTDHLRAMGR